MTMRVTQKMMYGSIIQQMNMNLANLQESNLQSSTQKKVNRPSDDPAGMANILSFRGSLSDIDDYYKNTNTAKGWLTLADSTLQQVSTIITQAKTLAEQASTGTYTAAQRQGIGTQVRELLNSILNIANQKFGDQHIYAGHKTDAPPFEEALSVTCNDPAMKGVEYSVEGASHSTIVTQFLSSGTIGTDALNYRYSSDGGSTWQNGSMAAGDTFLNLGGVRVNVFPATGTPTVTAVDTTNLNENNNGTWFYVRPSAQYMGDDEDAITVDNYGASGVTGVAQGSFGREVVVRIDQPATLGSGTINYSYSTDGGSTWKGGNTANGSDGRLLVPGGYVTLSGGPSLNQGDQFYIRPRRATISLEVSPNDYLQINNIGKDVFGGIYQSPSDAYAKAAFGGDGRNLFEVLGRFVGYAETNSQQGCQQALDELTTAQTLILKTAANVGGRENRVTVTQQTLQTYAQSETTAMSNIEDVDLIALMTKLSQQQIAYQSVLKSSSMLMQLSLLNFI